MNDNEPTAYSESNEERSDELDNKQKKGERSSLLYRMLSLYINEDSL